MFCISIFSLNRRFSISGSRRRGLLLLVLVVDGSNLFAVSKVLHGSNYTYMQYSFRILSARMRLYSLSLGEIGSQIMMDLSNPLLLASLNRLRKKYDVELLCTFILYIHTLLMIVARCAFVAYSELRIGRVCRKNALHDRSQE